MKVLFLVSDPSLGPDVPFGDSIRVRLLVAALQEAGHSVDVRWAGPAAAPTRIGPPVRRRAPAMLRPVARDVRSLARAAAFLRRLRGIDRPDVVFEFASYLAPIGPLLARRVAAPYVVEVEGPLAELRYAEGGTGLRALGDRLERRRLAVADAVVAVSAPLADRLVAEGAPRERTLVLPNVADMDRFRPDPEARLHARRRLGLDEDAVAVGFHGVFSPWYGLDVLVAALAEVQAAEVVLVLVGDGVERGRVERLLAEHRLAARVRITGFVPHEDVPAYVDAFDIAVVPDHVWWTSPLKLFEYGAMRKPVIAARAPSIQGVVGDGEAVLVEPRSPGALADAIEALVREPARRAALADAWSARVTAEHGYPRLVERLDEALSRVAL